MSTHETVFFARGMLWKGYYCSCYLRKHPRIESQRANKAADKEIHIRTTAFLADHPISSSLPFGFLLLSDFSRNSHAFTAPMPKDVRAEEIHCGAISGSSRTEHLIFHQRGGGGVSCIPYVFILGMAKEVQGQGIRDRAISAAWGQTCPPFPRSGFFKVPYFHTRLFGSSRRIIWIDGRRNLIVE